MTNSRRPILQSSHFFTCVLFLACLSFGCSSSTSEQSSLEARASQSNREAKHQVSSQDLLRNAESLLSQNEFAAARMQLRELLVLDPNHVAAKFLLAQCEAQLGDIDVGVELLKSIPLEDKKFGLPSAGQAAEWLGRRGDIFEAKKLYEEILLEYDVPLVRHQFARFLNSLGWRRQARDVLQPLVHAGRASEDELRGMLNLSSDYASLLIRTSKNKDVFDRVGQLGLALNRLNFNRPRDAVEILSPFKEARDPEITAVLAAALAELQRFDALLQLIETAPESTHQSPFLWRAIGDYYATENDLENSIAAYLQSLRIDATSLPVHERLEGVLSEAGKREEANRVAERRRRLKVLKGAGKSIQEGAPDDLRAGLDLVKDLEVLGYPLQASCWLQHLASRHSQDPRFTDLESELRRLRGIPIERQTAARLSNIDQDVNQAVIPRSVGAPDKIPNSPLKSIGEKTLAEPNLVDVAVSAGIEFQLQNAPVPQERFFSAAARAW